MNRSLMNRDREGGPGRCKYKKANIPVSRIQERNPGDEALKVC